MSIFDRTEQNAIKIGRDRVKLRKRLEEAIDVMYPADRKRFTPRRECRLSFEEKRLYSLDERAFLEWRVREFPDMPESYENQQTNGGSVSLWGIRNSNHEK